MTTLDLSTKARPFTWVRSPVRSPPRSVRTAFVSTLVRRKDSDADIIDCPYLPLQYHLVAKGSCPPRTWSSALFADLVARDGDEALLAKAVQGFVLSAVQHLLQDPKGNDDAEAGGEYFGAWLREVHRELYDDIDHTDLAVLLQRQWMHSESDENSGKKRKRHDIGSITVPGVEEAFKEIMDGFKVDKAPTRRMSVLAKILIDIWVVHLVDFASMLKVLQVVASSPQKRVVVVCYLGTAHTSFQERFWRANGFHHRGLKEGGMVGKKEWGDDESRKLDLPPCLRDLSELFPVPG
eukprot:gnl/MRDRNA2_/MRDRNA2_132423_c0_seq1.p1 gnl/MRDRNA2_/MRDRNA2_132423_c0~~gnl/MRDRNA2_/MRDRNA2_132423_c0_seq1.p1  ORF type:complete len:342 (-),score=62.48 gnl/MRDRNA2_/MRDRNA2_132423_c0_seq1:26-907(-)